MGYVENIKSIMQWGNSFERQSNFPLDRTDLHISYDDAVLYAKGDGSDSRGLGKLAYIGQTITVWGLNEKGKDGVWVYSLVPHTPDPADENDTALADLQPVGTGAAPESSNNYTSAVELSADLTAGQLIYVNNEEDVTVGEATQTYKKGWYIVNAPGSISALDTSTGASDEIGALTNRVADLESNRVLSSDFEKYKGEVSTALDGKVSNDAFDTYKGEVTDAIGEVSTALDTYKGEVSTALDGKVGTDAFDTYKGEVSTALDGKASTDALNTLEGKVDTDIQNLTNLVSDYSGTLGDVDDRLVELEEFVDSHIYHEFIPISDIEGLFGTQTEE
jgi:uncharacterized protein YjbJ (UPF0337 family)